MCFWVRCMELHNFRRHSLYVLVFFSRASRCNTNLLWYLVSCRVFFIFSCCTVFFWFYFFVLVSAPARGPTSLCLGRRSASSSNSWDTWRGRSQEWTVIIDQAQTLRNKIKHQRFTSELKRLQWLEPAFSYSITLADAFVLKYNYFRCVITEMVVVRRLASWYRKMSFGDLG